ncbi:MAG: hypothetical protein ACM3ZQ_01545 [Bacillota bacterium]
MSGLSTFLTSPLMTSVGLYIAGLITLAGFSYLYKENPFYRWAEYTYVGIVAANGITYSWTNVIVPTWNREVVQGGHMAYVFVAIFSLLIYARYFQKIAWFARIPMSVWVGYGMGTVLAFDVAPFLTQVTNTFTKFKSLNDAIFFLGAVCVMTYFIFTVRVDKGALRYPSQAGKIVLLVAFGAYFAYNVMSYSSLVMGRLQFLFGDVLKLL